MSEPRRHLGAGAALSVIAQAGPLAAAAALSIVLARTIGPSGNGHFVLLVTLVGLTSMIVSLVPSRLSDGVVQPPTIMPASVVTTSAARDYMMLLRCSQP